MRGSSKLHKYTNKIRRMICYVENNSRHKIRKNISSIVDGGMEDVPSCFVFLIQNIYTKEFI